MACWSVLAIWFILNMAIAGDGHLSKNVLSLANIAGRNANDAEGAYGISVGIQGASSDFSAGLIIRSISSCCSF
jgi:hypothetical protein